MDTIIVVGLGGIGSQLVSPLCRYLASHDDCDDVVLVDGDSYSFANADRQTMLSRDVGRNKAAVQAEKLTREFPALTVSAFEHYIGPRNVREIIGEKSCVLLCVDNHATRKLLSDHCGRLDDVLLISAGNELTDGNVMVYQRTAGRQKTPPLDRYHDEIRYPADENPADLSCEELALRPGGGQVIFTNLMAAALMLNAYYMALAGAMPYGEVYFDICTNKANAFVRR